MQLLLVLFVSRHWIFKRKNKHSCPNVTFLERRLSWRHRCVESCCANEQHLMNGNSLWRAFLFFFSLLFLMINNAMMTVLGYLSSCLHPHCEKLGKASERVRDLPKVKHLVTSGYGIGPSFRAVQPCQTYVSVHPSKDPSHHPSSQIWLPPLALHSCRLSPCSQRD